MKKLLLLLLSATLSLAAEGHPLEALLQAARSDSPALRDLLPASLHSIKTRGGAAVWGQDFIFAIEIATTPTVSINRQAPVAMRRVPETNLWYLTARLRTGVTHSYEFFSDGEPMDELFSYDVAGYTVDSYPRPGVAAGTMSPKRTLVSTVYDGLSTDYWVYASAGVDPSRPSPVMIWQDGEMMIADRDLVRMRLAIVTDNLVHQKIIPPMIHVLIAPGQGARGRQYGAISDRYGRYLLEEILPAVNRDFRLRPDAYSRAIAGSSAGGICAFNTAWHFPREFSRIYTHVGSFTSLAGDAGSSDGSYLYPMKIRQQPRKNFRIWLSSGTYDYENARASFPLQNIQMANALKSQGYDFHFRFGEAMHSVGQQALDLPEMLAWLWRGYDPIVVQQTYEMESAERAQPPFRVKISNREAW
jgi:enterochelin esterase family protein